MNTFKTIIMHWAAAGIFACLLAQAPIATAMNFPPGWTPDVNNPNDIFSADACNRTQQAGVNVIYATLPGGGENDPCLCAMTVPNPATGTVDIVINPNACGTDHICAVLGEEAMHATQLKATMAACAAKFPNSLSDQEACVVCTTDAHTIVFEAHAACYGVASGAGQPASDTNPNSQACSDTENTQPQLCGKWCDYIAENPPGTTAPDPSLECASGSVINSSDTPNLDFHVDNADSMCDWAPTPTPTPSGSGTPTPTPTPSGSETPTPTPTPTSTPSSSSSSTPTPTPTATPSNSGTSTPTPTPTPTYSGSASPTPTATPTITYSYSPSPS